jgi:hypothetical protein
MECVFESKLTSEELEYKSHKNINYLEIYMFKVNEYFNGNVKLLAF